MTTATVKRVARENGLFFPPDPGAAEVSHIGGNVATNAGGPHALKYGVTGRWVTGVEVVVPPGDVVVFGGAVNKDVAGYDLKNLIIGSEGTLGIVTGVWLRLLPAPQAAFPIAASFGNVEAGCSAVLDLAANGLNVAALEYLDSGALEITSRTFPGRAGLPPSAAFMLLADADGGAEEAAALRREVIEVFSETALSTYAPTAAAEVAAVWRWRESVSLAVAAKRGGKCSEDIAVPVDRLAEAIHETVQIGLRHGLTACSWGHAGDGNLHSTFLIDARAPDEVQRASAAAVDLFDLAVSLGGTISGEHGLGWLKAGELKRQWTSPALTLHEKVKAAFDPKGLLNPGKKTAQ